MPNQYSESHKSRILAKTLGLKYYEGSTCKRCGSTFKNINHSGCLYCHRERNKHKLFDGTMEKYRNRAQSNAKTYRYRMKKRNQTPISANNTLILEFYKESERLTKLHGIQYHVDHIIPVSKGGLHHQDNLQVLPYFENISKGNKIVI